MAASALVVLSTYFVSPESQHFLCYLYLTDYTLTDYALNTENGIIFFQPFARIISLLRYPQTRSVTPDPLINRRVETRAKLNNFEQAQARWATLTLLTLGGLRAEHRSQQKTFKIVEGTNKSVEKAEKYSPR